MTATPIINPTSSSSLPNTFRTATIAEDDILAGILYNAFLPLWNHNWFQGLYSPLAPIDPVAPLTTLSPLQRDRRAFYHALIKMTRLLGGDIFVLTDEDNHDTSPTTTSNHSTTTSSTSIHAILLWLPPNRRATPLSLLSGYHSGFLSLFFSPFGPSYGPTSFYRVFSIYESYVEALLHAAHIPGSSCGFPQMVAANPLHKGNRSGSRLLAWGVERHKRMWPGVDVYLDTSTEEGRRAYERLGFEVVGEKEVETGTDKEGCWVRGRVIGEEEMREVRKVCRVWVMVKRL